MACTPFWVPVFRQRRPWWMFVLGVLVYPWRKRLDKYDPPEWGVWRKSFYDDGGEG